MVDQQHLNMQQEKGNNHLILPPNVCYLEDNDLNWTYLSMVTGNFLSRSYCKVTMFGNMKLRSLYDSFIMWNP
jgi:hypothetical protein